MEVAKDWLVTFSRIIVKPSPQTFVAEAQKAKGKFASAIAWVAFTAVVVQLIIYNLGGFFSLSKLIKAFLFTPIVFLFFVFCMHNFYQKFFGKKKYYDEEMLYLSVGIFAPFVLAGFLVTYIPVVGGVLSWIALVYPVILTVIAVTAITKLKIWQSVIVVFSSLVLATIGYFVIPALILSLMSSTRF